VPIVTDPSRPGWTVLVDGEGRRLGRFLAAENEGRRRAELFELEAGVEPAVAAIRSELAGWFVVGDERLGHALVAAGGRLVRHSHVLSRDLRAEPATSAGALPDDLELHPADRPAADLVPAYRSAFSPEHIDGAARVDEDPLRELERILEGRAVGPVLECSGLAVDAAGDVCAAVLITDSGGRPPLGGPWIAECFRDRLPRHAGAGRALLEQTLLRATRNGLPAIGLAVTDGNRARDLYAALGFRDVITALSVEL